MDVETKEDALCVSEHDVIKATQSFHGNHDRLSDEDIQFVIEMHPVIQPYGPCDTWGMMSGVTNPYVVEHEVVQVPPVKAAPKPLVKTPFRIYDEAGAAASMCGCSGRTRYSPIALLGCSLLYRWTIWLAKSLRKEVFCCQGSHEGADSNHSPLLFMST